MRDRKQGWPRTLHIHQRLRRPAKKDETSAQKAVTVQKDHSIATGHRTGEGDWELGSSRAGKPLWDWAAGLSIGGRRAGLDFLGAVLVEGRGWLGTSEALVAVAGRHRVESPAAAGRPGPDRNIPSRDLAKRNGKIFSLDRSTHSHSAATHSSEQPGVLLVSSERQTRARPH